MTDYHIASADCPECGETLETGQVARDFVSIECPRCNRSGAMSHDGRRIAFSDTKLNLYASPIGMARFMTEEQYRQSSLMDRYYDQVV